MPSKAERTSQFIIETVAPIFNKYGYTGTSMHDLTEATGLTKGAIYGNFKDKEALAIAAFNHNVRKTIGKLSEQINKTEGALQKLKVLTDFYRQEYLPHALAMGGCPLLHVGADSLYQQPALFARVKSVILKLKNSITELIRAGIDQGELKADLQVATYANRIFALIEGSIFMSITLDDPAYVKDGMDLIDHMVLTEMKR